jgi:hypothetical protein
MEPDTHEPQHNISYEAVIIDHTSETGSITPGSGHHIEEPVPTFVESLAYFVNPSFIDPLGQPLFGPPSMRYIDSYSSYCLLPGSTMTSSFGMNPPIFGFLEGLGNSSFSTTPIVDAAGAYSLPETLVTQVTLTQPLTHSSPLAHESGNIPVSFFPHMHTTSDLLGHPIGQMANSLAIHTTMVTQATQPPSHTSYISTPYIGGQSSMGANLQLGGNLQLQRNFLLGGNLHGCNINRHGGKPLLQVLVSLLPLVCILGIHIQELRILCGLNPTQWAFLHKELCHINL